MGEHPVVGHHDHPRLVALLDHPVELEVVVTRHGGSELSCAEVHNIVRVDMGMGIGHRTAVAPQNLVNKVS